MKKLSLFILAFLLALPAAAQEKKHSLSLAFETSNYSYREPSLQYPPDWSGTMYGVSAQYTGRSLFTDGTEISAEDRSFLNFELRYMQGDVDYDGYLQDGTTFKAKDIGDYYFEGALTAGAVYDIGQSGFSLWPYLGLGARYLVDRLNESGSGGYRRTSTYIYMPIGLKAKQELSNGWSLSANGQLDVLLSGRQSSKDIGGELSIRNKQDEGYGLRGSVKLQKDFKNFGIFAEPFIRYWHIQNSDKALVTDGVYIYEFVEPKNETREYGLKIGLVF